MPQYDEGVYRCKILEQGFSRAKTGTHQFWLRFLVLSRITGDGGEEDVAAKRERMLYMAITAKTVVRVMKALQSLGFDGKQFEALDPTLADYHSFREKVADFSCAWDDYDGNTREKWEVYSQFIPTSEPGIASELDAMLAKETHAPKTQHKEMKEEEFKGPISTDEEVPF